MPHADRAAVTLSAVLPYAATIFISSFLLFLVQPIIAKQILPWFGGSAAVWTTCLVFFQSALLAGYAYADLTTRLGPRRQALLHLALLLASLAFLPIIASNSWKPQGDEAPILAILLLLTATIGLPYFLLSTTTPLLQAWYWRRFQSAVPYRLFALSNLASLTALLGFPVLFEPLLTLPQLGWIWSALYAALVLLCGSITWRSIAVLPAAEAAVHARGVPPALGTQLQWFALAGMGSVMLLATTNHVTQNIASVPFLWVLPLSLYLLSFILAFDHPRWYRREVFLIALAGLLPAMAWTMNSLDLRLAVPVYFAGLFAACMLCHGELAQRKPEPRQLTRFYLMLSLGGAAGAVLVAIAAPLALNGYFELGIALVLLAVLVSASMRGLARAAGAAVLVATLALVGRGVFDYTDNVRVMRRDFYGVVRTRDHPNPVPYRAMYHGAIMHGGQLLGEAQRNVPSDYFGPSTGYGRTFRALRELRPRQPLKVGILGLGAGVIAAYGQAGDEFVFYEISPRVAEIAGSEFSFLKHTAAASAVVMGDGRLSLEREAPRHYDLLGIDAFAGDSIPMHLITREAMAIYLRHLKPDGVIVFQATNRFVDLMPVVKRLAAEFGFEAVLVSDSPADAGGSGYWYSSTDQIIVTRSQALLGLPLLAEAAVPIEARADLPVFTDAHHNLLRILK